MSADSLIIGCIEDDPLLSVLLADMLTQAGFYVVASDGVALQALFAAKPPIVLLDLGLPPCRMCQMSAWSC